MKNFSEYLQENSLYDSTTKDTFIKKDRLVMGAFLVNFIGIIAAFESAANKTKIVNYVKSDLKVRLDNITDDNHDISLVIKLMADRGFFLKKTTPAYLTRFLAKFKTGGIKEIDPKIIQGWLGEIKPNSLLAVEHQLRTAVSELIQDGDLAKFAIHLRDNRVKYKDFIGDFHTITRGIKLVPKGASAANPVPQPAKSADKPADKPAKSAVDAAAAKAAADGKVVPITKPAPPKAKEELKTMDIPKMQLKIVEWIQEKDYSYADFASEYTISKGDYNELIAAILRNSNMQRFKEPKNFENLKTFTDQVAKSNWKKLINKSNFLNRFTDLRSAERYGAVNLFNCHMGLIRSGIAATLPYASELINHNTMPWRYFFNSFYRTWTRGTGTLNRASLTKEFNRSIDSQEHDPKVTYDNIKFCFDNILGNTKYNMWNYLEEAKTVVFALLFGQTDEEIKKVILGHSNTNIAPTADGKLKYNPKEIDGDFPIIGEVYKSLGAVEADEDDELELAWAEATGDKNNWNKINDLLNNGVLSPNEFVDGWIERLIPESYTLEQLYDIILGRASGWGKSQTTIRDAALGAYKDKFKEIFDKAKLPRDNWFDQTAYQALVNGVYGQPNDFSDVIKLYVGEKWLLDDHPSDDPILLSFINSANYTVSRNVKNMISYGNDKDGIKKAFVDMTEQLMERIAKYGDFYLKNTSNQDPMKQNKTIEQMDTMAYKVINILEAVGESYDRVEDIRADFAAALTRQGQLEKLYGKMPIGERGRIQSWGVNPSKALDFATKSGNYNTFGKLPKMSQAGILNYMRDAVAENSKSDRAELSMDWSAFRWIQDAEFFTAMDTEIIKTFSGTAVSNLVDQINAGKLDQEAGKIVVERWLSAKPENFDRAVGYASDESLFPTFMKMIRVTDKLDDHMGDIANLIPKMNSYRRYNWMNEHIRQLKQDDHPLRRNPEAFKRVVISNLNALDKDNKLKWEYQESVPDAAESWIQLLDIDDKAAEDFYKSCSKSMKRRLANFYMGAKGFAGHIEQALYSEDSPIQPYQKLTKKRIGEILKYNNITNADTELKDSQITNFAKMDQIIKDESNKDAGINDLQVEEVKKTKQEMNALTAEYHRTKRNNKHGRSGMRFIREFNVAIPIQVEGQEKWIETHPDSEVINPMYHGTGSIAASMILRYGFRVLKAGDGSVVGRMLGDGIYGAIHIDKSQQYIGDEGYSRRTGTKGYIFAMNAVLGEPKKDYAVAGLGNDRIRSPEWCVFHGNEQFKIYKAWEVELIDEYEVAALLKTYPVKESVRTFKQYIKEEEDMNNVENVKTYTFTTGNIPVDHATCVKFEEWKSPNDNVTVEPSAHGVTVVVTGTDEDVNYSFYSFDQLKYDHPDILDEFIAYTRK